MSKAIDEVRAKETRELKEQGGLEPVLTKSRWILLKRPENLTEKQDTKLAELVKLNLRSIRSYLLKEEFQLFWNHVSPYWAELFLDNWCTKTVFVKTVVR
uniref:Transposase n=1 Tax=Candidatus Kentrum sp. LPFa TaxID=2126335 RepID=A0A450Y455_9GAMM|nr:MAG: Transposase [Candidatus Kentron sp. LPFa]VFK36320.1 MAG: Transposase [Candidatus Kentron sp. LPFa]